MIRRWYEITCDYCGCASHYKGAAAAASLGKDNRCNALNVKKRQSIDTYTTAYMVYPTVTWRIASGMSVLYVVMQFINTWESSKD